jgi:hypothetical protein
MSMYPKAPTRLRAGLGRVRKRLLERPQRQGVSIERDVPGPPRHGEQGRDAEGERQSLGPAEVAGRQQPGEDDRRQQDDRRGLGQEAQAGDRADERRVPDPPALARRPDEQRQAPGDQAVEQGVVADGGMERDHHRHQDQGRGRCRPDGPHPRPPRAAIDAGQRQEPDEDVREPDEQPRARVVEPCAGQLAPPGEQRVIEGRLVGLVALEVAWPEHGEALSLEQAHGVVRVLPFVGGADVRHLDRRAGLRVALAQEDPGRAVRGGCGERDAPRGKEDRDRRRPCMVPHCCECIRLADLLS